jgi:uncharacterized radical SAM protein YgiQ
MSFLPISQKDLSLRGWDGLDVILVTGDAYVDHPSFGAAVIGRVLEHAGFKVGVIAQPDWRSSADFTRLGKPRLFFGVTAGNLDSMVANYSANKRPRKTDEYSPGGRAGLRPDRATIVYVNRIREAFKEIPIVVGGIEASLRRLAHYDWWENGVRRSILLDARADLLVFGMGEQQIVEIARRLEAGRELRGIAGTARVANDLQELADRVEIPSFEETQQDKERFNQAFRMLYNEQDPVRGKPVVQKHGNRFVVQYPPVLPLTPRELDEIYALPYERTYHPGYERAGGIPGFETVRFSIISHRGCCGECAFCSLGMHQGRMIQSRSSASVLKEAERISGGKDFRGTITDVGGPTANLYQARCDRWEDKGTCSHRQCLMPRKCPSLALGYPESIKLYRSILAIPKVKHLFIESGLRYDLLLGDRAAAGSSAKFEANYIEQLCGHHISGQLKVAPEHTVGRVLSIMNKPDLGVYEEFVERFKETNRRLNKTQYLVNYLISAHPGSTLADALSLSLYLMRRRMNPHQIQDFIPLPMTLSGCMFYTGKHPFTGDAVYVPDTFRERKMQRALIQWRDQKNRSLVREALVLLKREDLRAEYERAWRSYDARDRSKQHASA